MYACGIGWRPSEEPIMRRVAARQLCAERVAGSDGSRVQSPIGEQRILVASCRKSGRSAPGERDFGSERLNRVGLESLQRRIRMSAIPFVRL